MVVKSRKRTHGFSGSLANLRERPRLGSAAIVFGGLVGIFIFSRFGIARSILLSFDIAAALFLALAAWMFGHSNTTSMRRRARVEDNGRWGVLLSSVAVSAVVLVALGVELQASMESNALEISLAAISLLLSWLFVNTMFTLHYAHFFYSGSIGKQALSFPGTPDPDYWDFAYFAMVIGMTFQVSDVQITDRRLRRVALMHGVIAFFFNVVIVALSVNAIAGKT